MSKSSKKKPPRSQQAPRRVDAPPEPNLHRGVLLVKRLMQIPGPSGQEGAVARHVIGQLQQAGASPAWIVTDNAHEHTPTPGEVGNLILKLPGTLPGPRRLLMAHLDTVPLCVGSRPMQRGLFFRSGNPASGLGADNRAGTAVILLAAMEILRRRLPHPPLTFVWTVQEEPGLQGARLMQLGKLGRPALGFNFDGGVPSRLTIGATGGYRMTITIDGKASHAGGAPERGVSAIAIAALAIAKLHTSGWHGLIEQGNQRGTSNVGYIHGGGPTNVVTDHVVLRAEARSHQRAFRTRIVKQIVQAFRQAAREVVSKEGKRGRVKIEGRLDYEAFLLDEKEPCVQVAEAVLRSVGEWPHHAITNGGLDANWLVAHGIPTVTLGCGQQNPHMRNEGLDIAAFQTACRIALRLATASEHPTDSTPEPQVS